MTTLGLLYRAVWKEGAIWDQPKLDARSDFAVARTGTFALGRRKSDAWTAYWHAGGDNDWRSARGLPVGGFATDSFARPKIALLDDGHAIVVWQTPNGAASASIRAAFIE